MAPACAMGHAPTIVFATLTAASVSAFKMQPVFSQRLPSLRKAGCHITACVQEDFWAEEGWTEAGYATVETLPSVMKSLNQPVGESEHMAIAMLGDEKGMFCKVLTAAGASALDIKRSFLAYADTQPKVFSHESATTSNLNVGASLRSLMQCTKAQQKLLTDNFLSAEHVSPSA